MPGVESEFAIRSPSWRVARKQLRFFDLSDHLKRLSEAGEPLEEMARVIDFEAFRPLLEAALAYSDGGNCGRPPYHPVAIFRAFTLAARNNVTDARMEFLIRERLSWLRLRGFDLGEPTPDEHTMRRFRERLTGAAAIQPLFEDLNREARKGDAVQGATYDGNPLGGSRSSGPSPSPTHPLRFLKTASALAIRAVRLTPTTGSCFLPISSLWRRICAGSVRATAGDGGRTVSAKKASHSSTSNKRIHHGTSRHHRESDDLYSARSVQ